MIHPERIAEIMGGVTILGHEIRSFQDLEASVSHGLPKSALRRTVERVYTTASDVRQAVYRIVPEATFKRRNRLSHEEGARTERLARVIAAAEYAWDSQADAKEWLTKPHPELAGRTPLDASMSELGARRVEQVLDSLVFGIPA